MLLIAVKSICVALIGMLPPDALSSTISYRAQWQLGSHIVSVLLLSSCFFHSIGRRDVYKSFFGSSNEWY
jgi:hypothetical protein